MSYIFSYIHNIMYAYAYACACMRIHKYMYIYIYIYCIFACICFYGMRMRRCADRVNNMYHVKQLARDRAIDIDRVKIAIAITVSRARWPFVYLCRCWFLWRQSVSSSLSAIAVTICRIWIRRHAFCLAAIGNFKSKSKLHNSLWKQLAPCVLL